MKRSEVERLNKMLLNDSLKFPGANQEIVKNELVDVLDAYFDVDEKSVRFLIRPSDDSKYEFCLQGIVSGAKKVRTIE